MWKGALWGRQDNNKCGKEMKVCNGGSETECTKYICKIVKG